MSDPLLRRDADWASGLPAPLPPEPFRIPLPNALLFVATLVTTTLAGAFNAGVAGSELATRWTDGLPFSLTLIGILLAHEMGHYLCARFHGVRATLPFFLPAPPTLAGFGIGTFGAFIRMRSSPPDRRALFDVGAAGPWAGFVIALPAAIWGLHLSELAPIRAETWGIYLGDSLTFKALSRLVIGPIPPGFDVMLHPVALAAWFGLFVTALNLLPVGQLDGGHVVYSLFGRGHRFVARAMLLAVVLLGLLGWAGWFVWTVLLLVMGVDHPPTIDRTTPLDPARRGLAWATLALFAVTLVPVPFSVMEGVWEPPAGELQSARLETPR